MTLCRELDVVSQGDTIEEPRNNWREALKLFLESASPDEIKPLRPDELLVTRIEAAVG